MNRRINKRTARWINEKRWMDGIYTCLWGRVIHFVRYIFVYIYIYFNQNTKGRKDSEESEESPELPAIFALPEGIPNPFPFEKEGCCEKRPELKLRSISLPTRPLPNGERGCTETHIAVLLTEPNGTVRVQRRPSVLAD